MTEPIKAGDTCIVIGGALFDSSYRGKGPNLGKRVTVKVLRGEHSIQADFAASWLQKADPLPPETTTTNKELDTTT